MNTQIIGQKFNEKSLTEKEKLYSKLNIQDINELGYRNANKIWNKFSIKDLREKKQYILIRTYQMSVKKCMVLILLIFILDQSVIAW